MTSKVNKSTEPHGKGKSKGDSGEHPIPLQSKPVVQPQGNVEVEQPKTTPTNLEKNAGDEAGQQSTMPSTPVSPPLQILKLFLVFWEFEWDNIAKKSFGISLVGFFVAKFRLRIGWVAFEMGVMFSISDYVARLY